MLPKFLVIIATSLVTLHVAGQPNKGADRENAHPQNKSPITATSNKEQNTECATKSPNCNPPRRDASAERPEWWLVGVGIATIFVIGWQAIETRRATGVAQEGIKVVAEESRPWLIIKKANDPYLVPLAEVPPPWGKFTYCIVSVENSGKTPARIISSQVEMWIGDRVDMPPPMFKLRDGYDVLEEDSYLFPAGSTRQSEARLNPTGIITPGERDSVTVSKTRFLWLCGAIRYRGTFARPDAPDYETRFCYRYETRLNTPQPIWMLAGPPEYNRTT